MVLSAGFDSRPLFSPSEINSVITELSHFDSESTKDPWRVKPKAKYAQTAFATSLECFEAARMLMKPYQRAAILVQCQIGIANRD